MQVRDIDIIALFDRRDEQAIAEMQRKYGSYCRTVALNILKNASDAEECLNDVWLKVWNSIPPAAPDDLKNYAGEVTRNTALDMLRKRKTKRSNPAGGTVSLEDVDRGGQQVTDPWTDPLGVGSGSAGATIADGGDPSGARTMGLVADYLRTLKPKKRKIFFARYYYDRSVDDIARIMNIPRGTVLSNLNRTREGLRAFLEAEGVEI
jgi:RNA polymerase sigma-70 factor (ECF subfamily)